MDLNKIVTENSLPVYIFFRKTH